MIIGHGDGDGFAVNIDSTATLDDLMDKIKNAHPRIIYEGGADLKLYLAKKPNGKWLQDDDADAISLSIGVPDVITKNVDHDLRLRRTRSLGSYFNNVTATTDATLNSNRIIRVVVLFPKCPPENPAITASSCTRYESQSHPLCVISRS